MAKAPQGNPTPTAPLVAVTNPMANSMALTAQSAYFQHFAPNAANLAFSLPNPATLLPGWEFTFKNLTTNGAFPVQILDFAGNLAGWTLPGATVLFVMESNINTQGGIWRVETGNRASDNGIYEWGTTIEYAASAPIALQALGALGSHMIDAELGILTDMSFSSNSAAPIAFRCKDGAFQLGALGTAMATNTSAGSWNVDTCSNGSGEVLIAYGGSTTPCVASYTVNTSTLALTQAANKTGATKATKFVGMDAIASGNNALVYAETTTGQAWMAMITGNGAGLTFNTAVALSATTGMTVAQVAALSASLAHTLYSDGSSIYLNRVTISGTVPTPGTQSVIANRPLPGAGVFQSAAQIVKLNSTTSLAVYGGKNSNGGSFGGSVYGNVITDTGSGITQNEVLLVDDFASALPTNVQNLVFCGAYKGVNGSINCIFSDGAAYKMAIVKVVNGKPVISPMIDITLRGPLYSTSTTFNSLSQSIPRCLKTAAGNIVLPILEWAGAKQIGADFSTAGTNLASAVYNPVCLAPQ
ncbi:MAG TPA: hypothetical protein VF472_21855 [Burkholderiaceae bacterium]